MWPTTPKAQRGYGKDWDALRKQALERDKYLCQCPECKASGRIRKATEVDHIVRKADGGTNDLSNLRSVNHDCHKRITIIQAGKTPMVKTTTGLDGWPV